MDRNSIIGIVLIVLLVMGYSYYTQPTAAELAAQQRSKDSLALVNQQAQAAKALEAASQSQSNQATSSTVNDSLASSPDSASHLAAQQQYGIFANAANGTDTTAILENDKIKITFHTKGAAMTSILVKDYKTWDGKPVTLINNAHLFNLRFPLGNKVIETKSLYFTPTASANSLSLKLDAGEGRYLEYRYQLNPGSYLVDFKINTINLHQAIASNVNNLEADWQSPIMAQEKSLENERAASTIYFKFDQEEVDYLSTTSDETKNLTGNVKWISFKQQFFSQILIAAAPLENPTVTSTTNLKSTSEVKKFACSFTIPFNHTPAQSIGYTWYFGPNHYQSLKKIENLELEKQINLGWGIFGWVNRFLVIPVFNFLNGFHINFGIIILILTIIVRLVLLPLTYKSFQSQAKMKVLQPEVTELNDKYPDDPLKKQQEMMALYKRAGVNPMGGCLPGLLQLPILIAMFNFFPSSIELRQEHFLWATDLSTYDSILDLPFHIPGYGAHVSLFTLLMTASTLIYTRMNMQMSGAIQPQMKWLMYLMPIIFLGVFNRYAAGLSYYYFLSNIFGFAQQEIFKRTIDQDAIHRKIQENKKRPTTQTKSKFQQRLEDAAKARGYKLPK
ncbi:MAG: hypothetical protein RIQ89_950 [Bacteroidota bacterium]